MRASRRRPGATALLLVPGRAVEPQLDPSFDFVLVTDEDAWQDVATAGLDPIITHVRFSVTDPRSRAAARLGRAIMPWRWRRNLLNAGIATVHYSAGAPWAPLIGARLAGIRLTRRNPGR
ncbi:hypothetical protein IF650_03730 [Cellulosimicrobium terreum]|nr:hypothetical protein [Cellulosimicrobium terreum]